ncbi:unnamed protein product [Arabis nemorensis]|uniref:F-box domain-containing protein n=1 Tax=Arabis nemorensis TaxID=586526 RepID=A0A565C2J5_9BRAS|nr:unnamed protein product [Arabis nemorensis]
MASSSESRGLELPPELTCSILLRLKVEDILVNVQNVCRSWRRVCKDPSMWRKINHVNPEYMHDHNEVRLRDAVDRSEGGLVEIRIRNFGTDSILAYIADRFSLTFDWF